MKEKSFKEKSWDDKHFTSQGPWTSSLDASKLKQLFNLDQALSKWNSQDQCNQKNKKLHIFVEQNEIYSIWEIQFSVHISFNQIFFEKARITYYIYLYLWLNAFWCDTEIKKRTAIWQRIPSFNQLHKVIKNREI